MIEEYKPNTTSSSYLWVPTSPPITAKLSAALVAAQAEVRAAGKSGDNKFDKYTYSKLEDFLEAARPVLAKHKLALVMATTSCETLPERSTKNGGTEHAVRVCVTATLVHESGEKLVCNGYGEGQDRADKAIYKAITGAKKYVIAGLLAIPTTDDPESDETVGLANKAGAVKKLDSAGNAHTKMPTWLPDQLTEAGAYGSDIMRMLEQMHPTPGAALAKLKMWKDKRKYDAPADVLDAMAKYKSELEDILSNGDGK